MSRAHLLDFITALAIILCVLSLMGAIEDSDENARAEQVKAVRAAQADQALGIVRLAAR